ncbi:MAG: Holliday junction resolvase RuvX [Clostridia bacterium]|nr:Holliday junction resolvase RuvX [Clostridia bacterium]
MADKILGVDFGDTRTGLAVSDALGFMASPAGTVYSKYIVETAKKVADAAREHNVKKIVLGMPINMNGTEGPRAERVKEFAELLSGELEGIEIVFFDERCSTMAAHQILNLTDTRGKKRKEVVDTLSAQIILQNYMDSHK